MKRENLLAARDFLVSGLLVGRGAINKKSDIHISAKLVFFIISSSFEILKSFTSARHSVMLRINSGRWMKISARQRHWIFTNKTKNVNSLWWINFIDAFHLFHKNARDENFKFIHKKCAKDLMDYSSH